MIPRYAGLRLSVFAANAQRFQRWNQNFTEDPTLASFEQLTGYRL